MIEAGQESGRCSLGDGSNGRRGLGDRLSDGLSNRLSDGLSHRLAGLAGAQVNILLDLAVGVVLLGAIARDMPGFAALVASLASRAQRATVRSRAVARDVAEFATGVALHCLCLAITGIMVRPAALVASGRTRTTGKSAPAVSAECSPRYRRTPTQCWVGWVGASTLSCVRNGAGWTVEGSGFIRCNARIDGSCGSGRLQRRR